MPLSPEIVPAASLSSAGCSNVSGTISVQLTGPATGIGTVTGDLAGTITVAITGATAHGQGGASHLLLVHDFSPSGGTITTNDVAVLSPIAPPLFHLNVRYDIAGGTGQYAGASGFLRTHGEVNLAVGTVELRYHGRVCT